MNIKIFLSSAIEAAKAAGEIHLEYFSREFLPVKTKTSSFDRVTEADLKAEEKIVSFIKARFPEHNFLAEEQKYPSTSSEYTWIIDPLDGTNNFSHHLPFFCVSIALARGKDILLGVIYDPVRDELFSAVKGKGALLNNKPVKVSLSDNLSEALLITGFYYDRGEDMINALETIKHFLQLPVLGLRRLGSAALDLCYVACGRAAGFWEFKLNPWDFAAGKLIVEEAGGRVSGRNNEPLPLREAFVVASNALVHDKMISIINKKKDARAG